MGKVPCIVDGRFKLGERLVELEKSNGQCNKFVCILAECQRCFVVFLFSSSMFLELIVFENMLLCTNVVSNGKLAAVMPLWSI